MLASTIFYDLAGPSAAGSFSQVGPQPNSAMQSGSPSFVQQAEASNLQWLQSPQVAPCMISMESRHENSMAPRSCLQTTAPLADTFLGHQPQAFLQAPLPPSATSQAPAIDAASLSKLDRESLILPDPVVSIGDVSQERTKVTPASWLTANGFTNTRINYDSVGNEISQSSCHQVSSLANAFKALEYSLGSGSCKSEENDWSLKRV